MSSFISVQMTLVELQAFQSLMARIGGKSLESVPVPKVKKAKKEKDPNAPKREPNDWIKFTSRVRAVISKALEGEKDEKGAQKKAHPKAVTQTASALKEAGNMASATDEQILAAYKSWLANPPAISKMEKEGRNKKKSPAASVADSDSEAEAEAPAEATKKARKPMSEETKKAAAAKRAATLAKKAAEAAAPAPAPASAPAPAPAPAPAAEESDEEEEAEEADPVQDFSPWEHKGKTYVKNARGDVMTEALEWVGRFNTATGKVDKKFPKPSDLEC